MSSRKLRPFYLAPILGLLMLGSCIWLPYTPEVAVRDTASDPISRVYDPATIEGDRATARGHLLRSFIECLEERIKRDTELVVLERKALWNAAFPGKLFVWIDNLVTSTDIHANYVVALQVVEYSTTRKLPVAGPYGGPIGVHDETEVLRATATVFNVREGTIGPTVEAETQAKSQGVAFMIVGGWTFPLTRRAVCQALGGALVDALETVEHSDSVVFFTENS